MLFIGIDLAWSEKNATGIAVLRGDRNKAEFCFGGVVLSDEEIISCVNKHVRNKNAFIAIDAPLIVPNEEGRRIAEKLVGVLFRKYDAGAHPANRKRLSQWSGRIRGEEISRLLEKNRFKHEPYIERFEQSRKFFEVYPHPSMIVLFRLNKILQYKSKPKRDYNFLYNEFRKYQGYLKSLAKSKPALILPKKVVDKNVKELRAKALKNYEDLLDAIFCAYIAYYAWYYPEKCVVLGDTQQGYILTPVSEHMKRKLEEMKSQKRLVDF